MNKILFTDLDGTLLNNDSLISQNTKKALDLMIQSGNKLVLSSGRPLDSIIEVAKKAGIHYPGIYIIAYNGSLIYNYDKKINILEKRITFDDVMITWTLAREMNIHIQTYTDSSIITGKEDPEITLYRKKIHLPLILSDSPISVMDKPPFKLLAIDLYEKKHLISFSDALSNKYSDRLSTVFSNDHYLEIFSSEAGKGTALKYLCDYLNISISNSFAAGDALNDLSMLKAAGHSVAMCNGDPLLLRQADIISSKSNNEDGLADIIRKYLID